MNGQETLTFIRDQVKKAQATGAQGISFSDLETYLASLQKSIENLPPELQNVHPSKIQHEFSLAHYNWQKDASLEMFRSVIAAGQSALKASMLMNGGAAVALLAFIGNAASNLSTRPIVSKFALPLFLLVLGVFFSGVATGANYLTQLLYAKSLKPWGHGLNTISIIFTTISFLLFFYATYVAYGAFSKL